MNEKKTDETAKQDEKKCAGNCQCKAEQEVQEDGLTIISQGGCCGGVGKCVCSQ